MQGGGGALSTLSEHLALSVQTLTATLGEFSAAIDAMRAATPEALSKSVDLAVGAAQRTEQQTGEFLARMKEEIAEQRESLERRVLAVESGLEQTRNKFTTLQRDLSDQLDDLQNAVRGGRRSTSTWIILTLLVVVGSAAVQHASALKALVGI
jgi:hypothetical protein